MIRDDDPVFALRTGFLFAKLDNGLTPTPTSLWYCLMLPRYPLYLRTALGYKSTCVRCQAHSVGQNQASSEF
ncbi:hypothetical protein EVAR_58518_1 [Eumeta japonica]|uniref:Uncharacterized protein n=1 Tax=Eumeta variegata TaxID=151549 RepID=A0A4C1YYM2_EUMVA|nr:hypothetical protein EVAR_58518_1 [Eumeta japonica]